jgi:hypothetical protein
MAPKGLICDAAILTIFLCSAAQVHAKPLPHSGIFFYSSECYGEEGGDAGGGTFKLTRSPTGDRLEVGGAWNGPMESFVATDVQISDASSKGVSAITYTLTIPEIIERRTYTGTISAAAIRVKGVDGKYDVTPRRSMTYKPGVCH